MSHFTRIRTELRDIETVHRALEDMGYQVEEGQVRGFMHQRAQADIVARMDGGYDIGFRQTGDAVTMVADFWGLRIDREAFLEQVTQHYAYVTVLDQAQEQGFQVVAQETQQDGSLRLVVQRWA